MKTLALIVLALRPLLGLDLYMPVPEANPLTAETESPSGGVCFSTSASRATARWPARAATIPSSHSLTGDRSRAASTARRVRATLRPSSTAATAHRSSGTAARKASNSKSLEPILNPKELALTEAELRATHEIETCGGDRRAGQLRPHHPLR